MEYYFASEKDDADDIFELMSEWWREIKDDTIDIDREYFLYMHRMGALLTMCSRDEQGKLVACFVGAVAPDMFHRGERRVEQIAACFTKEYRTYFNYKGMLDTLEKVCTKLGYTGFTASIVEPRAQKALERKGYTFDVINMSRRI